MRTDPWSDDACPIARTMAVLGQKLKLVYLHQPGEADDGVTLIVRVVIRCAPLGVFGLVATTFADAGLAPDIVMSALDADVIKAYVELGLGIGIVASMAFDPERDRNLSMLPSDHLFGENLARIAVRKGHFLRGFAYRFIELCSPALGESVVRASLRPEVEREAVF